MPSNKRRLNSRKCLQSAWQVCKRWKPGLIGQILISVDIIAANKKEHAETKATLVKGAKDLLSSNAKSNLDEFKKQFAPEVLGQ